MNTRQKAVLLTAAALFALMGLFPPYLETATCKSRPDIPPVVQAGQYGLLFSPPPRVGNEDWTLTYRIDLSRLAIQWAVLGAITGAATLALRRASSAPPPEAPAPRPEPTRPPSSEAIRRQLP
jgi:hypothetical protein